MSFLGKLLKKRFDSGDYWRRRYKKDKTSGPGSYGRLARYKAEIVNEIILGREVVSVVEFGSGDGNQARLFEMDSYLGIDISPTVVESSRLAFADRRDWNFELAKDYLVECASHDMSMSLDVIYHLVEDEVFESYMQDLFTSAKRFVLVFASDHDALTKDVHVRHRNYSSWIDENAPDFFLVETFLHPFPADDASDIKETSFAHFKLFERQ